MYEKETIHVLVITNLYPTEEDPAASPAVKNQIDELQDMGIQIDLLRIEEENVLSYLAVAIKVFLLNFQAKRYDLIQSYYGYSGFIARLQLRCPVVATFVGSDILHSSGKLWANKDALIGRLAARLVDEVIVMTEEMKRASGRSDAHIIPFGVDTRTFKPGPSAAARQELGLPLSEKLVLFPWDPNRSVKRIDIINDAITLLQKEHPTARLLTVYNKPHEIMAAYMNACDVMVLASDHEGAPVSVREALACTLPVVSVDVGDVREMVEGVEHCYICQRTPEDIAEKLGRVLAAGGRSNGREKIKSVNTAQMTQKVRDIYLSRTEKTSG
jgi:glycosyltransferase involved in cell wall biosynthesis